MRNFYTGKSHSATFGAFAAFRDNHMPGVKATFCFSLSRYYIERLFSLSSQHLTAMRLGTQELQSYYLCVRAERFFSYLLENKRS